MPALIRVAMPVAVSVSGALKPKMIRAAPPMIMAIIAVTLMIASQNSVSPKTLTFIRLIEAISRTTASTQIHCATCGNQKPM
ncbi:hypothetical protein D9M71_787310 [compost metagenome]